MVGRGGVLDVEPVKQNHSLHGLYIDVVVWMAHTGKEGKSTKEAKGDGDIWSISHRSDTSHSAQVPSLNFSQGNRVLG